MCQTNIFYLLTIPSRSWSTIDSNIIKHAYKNASYHSPFSKPTTNQESNKDESILFVPTLRERLLRMKRQLSGNNRMFRSNDNNEPRTRTNDGDDHDDDNDAFLYFSISANKFGKRLCPVETSNYEDKGSRQTRTRFSAKVHTMHSFMIQPSCWTIILAFGVKASTRVN